NGTLSANTVILLAAAEQGEIFNTGGNATLLEAETVVLVAGGAVGGSGDVNAQALSGTGTLEVATGSSVAFIVNIGNSLQFFSSPNTALADAYAQALGIPTQSTNITSTAQNSAGREQANEVEEEGYIDPALFASITLYEVQGTGILLPADQREEEEDEDEDGEDAAASGSAVALGAVTATAL